MTAGSLSDPLIRIRRSPGGDSSTEVLVGAPEELIEARERFEREDHVLVSDFLDADIAAQVVDGLRVARFVSKRHDIGASEARLAEGEPIGSQLDFLVNDPRVLRAVAAISGHAGIGHCVGRVYRMDPDSDHRDEWHTDLEQGRLVAMGLNLSPEPFEGGELEFRDHNTKEPIRRVRNVGLGDALIFKISPRLAHRVAPVTGAAPRTVYAGWFTRGPGLASRLVAAARG